MNPTIGTIVVAVIAGIAIVTQALINAYSAKKQATAKEIAATKAEVAATKAEVAATKAEVAETKAEVIAVGKRIDGRMDLLLASIRQEGVHEGEKNMKALITEEAVRVAGVSLEAEKRAK